MPGGLDELPSFPAIDGLGGIVLAPCPDLDDDQRGAVEAHEVQLPETTAVTLLEYADSPALKISAGSFFPEETGPLGPGEHPI